MKAPGCWVGLLWALASLKGAEDFSAPWQLAAQLGPEPAKKSSDHRGCSRQLMAYLPQQRKVMVAQPAPGRVHGWDFDSRQPAPGFPWDLPQENLLQLAASADEQYLAVLTQRQVVVCRVQDGSELWREDIPKRQDKPMAGENAWKSVLFLPRNRLLLLGPETQIRDAIEGQQAGFWPTPEIRYGAWNACRLDSSVLCIYYPGRPLCFLHAETGQPLGHLTDRCGFVPAGQFRVPP